MLVENEPPEQGRGPKDALLRVMDLARGAPGGELRRDQSGDLRAHLALRTGLGPEHGHHRPFDLGERALGLAPERLQGAVGGTGANGEDGEVVGGNDVRSPTKRPGEHQLLRCHRVLDHRAGHVEASGHGDVGVAGRRVLDAAGADHVEQLRGRAAPVERVGGRPEGEHLRPGYAQVGHDVVLSLRDTS